MIMSLLAAASRVALHSLRVSVAYCVIVDREPCNAINTSCCFETSKSFGSNRI